MQQEKASGHHKIQFAVRSHSRLNPCIHCRLRSRLVSVPRRLRENSSSSVRSVLAVVVSVQANPLAPNDLPTRYHVSGVIQLPYAEINEPFESWVDVEAGFSRIDYYGGKSHEASCQPIGSTIASSRCRKDTPTQRPKQ